MSTLVASVVALLCRTRTYANGIGADNRRSVGMSMFRLWCIENRLPSVEARGHGQVAEFQEAGAN